MGRVSKRKASGQQPAASYKGIRYKAGIYARLSSDQDTRKNESVDIQIDIAKKYVEKLNRQKNGEVIDVVECYTDLGKTGSNFEREGFQRLLQDVRLGEINCVIVKDLSRFGRNYLEAGNYIEKIFPFLGVRFIAVADDFDTGKEGNENRQMASEIKNLVNDMYAKDFSKKAKLHLKQRREEGAYVGGPPPYGYKADWHGKRRVLLPDENTEAIVRFIFEKFVEWENYTAVVNELNRRRLNPPYLYQKTKEMYYAGDVASYKGWARSAVERILKSETYAGILVQGKTSITARNEGNRTHKPENDWVVTKDAHEPLISKELYAMAVEVRQKIAARTAAQKHPTINCPIGENIFDQVLYCGVCGKKMTRDSHVKQCVDGRKERYDGYFCQNGVQTKVMVCQESNRISKTELLDILMPLIRMEFQVFLDKPKRYVEYGNKKIAEAARKAEADINKIERKIRCFREEESSMYMEYRAGKIPRNDYVSYKMEQEDRLADLVKQQEAAEKEKKALDKLSVKYLAAIKALVKLNSSKELTKDMVGTFISRIYVYPGKRIEVIFTVTADCMEISSGYPSMSNKQDNNKETSSGYPSMSKKQDNNKETSSGYPSMSNKQDNNMERVKE